MVSKLDSRPTRQLTSRECAKILGATIGGLCDMASVEDVRVAVRWWIETEDAWLPFLGNTTRPD
jgi:hypothetical protein